MWWNPQYPAEFSPDLVTFTGEILNGKLHILCVICYNHLLFDCRNSIFPTLMAIPLKYAISKVCHLGFSPLIVHHMNNMVVFLRFYSNLSKKTLYEKLHFLWTVTRSVFRTHSIRFKRFKSRWVVLLNAPS